MTTQDNFVVDWQLTVERAHIKPYVALRMRGRKVGLYRVRQMRQQGMVLAHGSTPLPVGTRLEVEDVQGLIPNLPVALVAQVVGSDQRGLRVAW